jgi:predicted  nucleic acid-binding Zn-ribbon protein
MEQAEAAQKDAAAAGASAKVDKAAADSQVAVLNQREGNLQKELAGLEVERKGLAAGVAATVLNRYERLLKSKGENVVVSIERGVCGGCHMQLSRQIVVDCRAQQDLVTCLNCGRILYFTPDMDVDLVD